MPAYPSLRQLHYLVTLAERLHFTRAARSCFVTQSTLSAGIRELEAALGVQLVERDSRRVILTQAGAEVAEQARAILAASSDLMQSARRGAAPLGGVLHLGVIPTIAPFLLPLVLPLMRRACPDLQIALREDLSGNLLKRTLSGELDAALLALPFDTGGLAVRALFVESLWLVAREDWKLPARADLRTLDTSQLLLLEEGHCLRGHTLEACGFSRRRNRSALEATSLFTLAQMADAGLGFALLPEMTLKARLLEGTQLRAVPLVPPPQRQIALISRATSARRAALEALSKAALQAHRGQRGKVA